MTVRPDLISGALFLLGCGLGWWERRGRELRRAAEAYRAAVRRARERQVQPHGASPAFPQLQRRMAA